MSFGCEPTAFEQSSEIGGTWNFTDKVDKDENGLEVHSSMYEGLTTNIPKEIMGYPDLPITKPSDKSFLSSHEIVDYLKCYASTFDLASYVKLEHHVLSVRPLLNDEWEFIVRNFRADRVETFIFDAVLVCNGISSPYMPKIPGQRLFAGKQLHSHHYRSSKLFENENVLIIGGGPSGIDLTVEIGKVAQRVVWSNHVIESLGMKVPLKLPSNALEKPDVAKLTENGVEFVDGSFEEFSAIVYATGYDYRYPFMSIDCGLSCHDKYVQPLYKHCININRPTLAIIGLPYFAVANPMFDLQVRFFLTFLTKKKLLPTRDEMLQDTAVEMNERFTRLKCNKAHFMGTEKHAQYYEELARLADIEPLKAVVPRIFNQTFANFFADFESCRNFHFEIIDDENFTMS